MKIFLTGCNGQLGRELIRQIKGKGYDYLATDIHNLDISDYQKVLQSVHQYIPDVVVNCAALTNVDECERNPDYAFTVNAIGARNLASAAFEVGAKIVHISTDYVFDGLGSTPLKEFDRTNPINVYGKSKELGEALVKNSNPRHYILRTAWLYGEGKNFVQTMLELGSKQGIVQVVNDQFGSPTSSIDLAKCILEGIINNIGYGTYHASCKGECSWFDFAKKIFEIKRMPVEVVAITTDQLNRPAARPKYGVMDNYMLKLCGKDIFRDWEASLAEYLQLY